MFAMLSRIATGLTRSLDAAQKQTSWPEPRNQRVHFGYGQLAVNRM